MEDLLQSNFGLKPQGKSAPMAASRSTVGGTGISSRSPPPNTGQSAWNSTGSFLGDHQNEFFSSSNNQNNQNRQDSGVYDDVFGGPPKFTKPSESRGTGYDDFFEGFKDQKKSSSLPVYDKPVYDEDILEGVPGLKSNSGVKYEDVFTSISSSTAPNSAAIDDFLGHFGRTGSDSKAQSGLRSREVRKEDSGFDELIPGFGVTNPPKNRETMATNRPHQPTVHSKSTSNILEDAFVVLESSPVPSYSSSGFFTEPLEPVSIPTSTGSTKDDDPPVTSTILNDINAFDGFSKSVSSEAKMNRKDKSPIRTGHHASQPPPTASKVPNNDRPASKSSEVNSRKAGGRTDVNASSYESNSQVNSPKSDDTLDTSDDAWLTVDEIPLFTQPTSAPPPSRPPPPLVIKQASDTKPDKRRASDFSSFPQPSQHYQFPRTTTDYGKTSSTLIDELEDFAMGNSQTYTVDHTDVLLSEEDTEANSAAAASAAAVEAMERAGAKMRQAREARERERDAKAGKSREPGWQDRDEKTAQEAQEKEYREKQERLDREREQREREENERERKIIEKEREEKEKGRIAVERATREARERAAAEARQKAERAAVGKANAEARQRAERSAVERATAEARERAAAEARERAEKAAAEARERERAERVASEARERAANEARERAAVDRAAADARARAERAAVERAYAEARERAAERAAAAAKDKQQKNDNDLDSFFGMGARPSSAPRQRATTSDSAFDTMFPNKGSPDGIRRTSVGTTAGTSSSLRKASSATNIVDDLSSIFGAAPSSGEFQEIEGEGEERRKARLERHMRTAERTAKALAEKKERDIQTQREQAERHRISETVDAEIKRWAAGKEGNLRALLSTMQYVLWPECGWQPVSLTDLITGASVKKVYRKATLCIHPDKVQQKGATIQQKYIAEKVFDLLKEAWNKFNSEELF